MGSAAMPHLAELGSGNALIVIFISFVNDFSQGVNGSSEPSRDYEAYLGRMGWAAFPFMAEMGFEKEPKGEEVVLQT